MLFGMVRAVNLTIKIFLVAGILMFTHIGAVANEQVEGDHISDGNEFYENEIVAIVNDKIITKGQLERDVSMAMPVLRSRSPNQESLARNIKIYEKNALNARIERALIVADFTKKGGKVPEYFEKNEYDNRVREYFHGDRLALLDFLRESGQTAREFKDDIRESAIVGFVLQNLPDAKREVGQLQLEKYYLDHKDEFVVERQVFLHEIVLDDEKYTPEELDGKISEIIEKLSAGCDVEDVVDSYSDSPKSAEIGWVCLSDLNREYVDAIEEFKSKKFFKPIKSGNKTIILFVSQDKDREVRSLEDVSDEIRNILTLENKNRARVDYIKELKKKAHIKIFVPSLAE